MIKYALIKWIGQSCGVGLLKSLVQYCDVMWNSETLLRNVISEGLLPPPRTGPAAVPALREHVRVARDT